LFKSFKHFRSNGKKSRAQHFKKCKTKVTRTKVNFWTKRNNDKLINYSIWDNSALLLFTFLYENILFSSTNFSFTQSEFDERAEIITPWSWWLVYSKNFACSFALFLSFCFWKKTYTSSSTWLKKPKLETEKETWNHYFPYFVWTLMLVSNIYMLSGMNMLLMLIHLLWIE